MSLREKSYLHGGQFGFVLKTVIINSLIMYYLHKNILYKVMDCVNKYELGNKYINSTYFYMALIIFAASVIITICLTKTFNNHLYGYKDEMQKSIAYELKYTAKFNLLNLIYLVMSICYLYNTLKIKKLFIVLLALAITLGFILYMWCIVYAHPPKAIISFTVREKTTTRIRLGEATFDGENDLELKLVNGDTVKINLFKEKLFIVEDNNLMILARGKYEPYSKEEVESIYLDNKQGNIIKVIFNGNEWQKA